MFQVFSSLKIRSSNNKLTFKQNLFPFKAYTFGEHQVKVIEEDSPHQSLQNDEGFKYRPLDTYNMDYTQITQGEEQLRVVDGPQLIFFC